MCIQAFSHLTFGPEIPAFTECIRGAWSTQREVAVSKLHSILNTTLIFFGSCALQAAACAWKEAVWQQDHMNERTKHLP
jgi:uncharacterized membrane protein YidH (DUF202 family)